MPSAVQLNQICVAVVKFPFMRVTVIYVNWKKWELLAHQMAAMWDRCHQLDAHWGKRDVNESKAE